jgi:kynurenine formamidase
VLARDRVVGAGAGWREPDHEHGAERGRYALGDDAPDPRFPEEPALQWAGERITLLFHGSVFTHIDGLGHVFYRGQMYNGRSAGLIKTSDGALVQTSDVMRDGIMTRGVLLDLARLRGVETLPPEPGVFPEDLEAAEQAQGVRVEEGDVLLLRTGYGAQVDAAIAAGEPIPEQHSGYHVACMPWIHERGVALLGSDVTNDKREQPYPKTRLPVHQVGLVAMGLRLIDNAHLERLAEACAQRSRWEFCFTLNPLRFEAGTGSPVNPIATL